MKKKIAFGLDLAGYSTGKSGLARVDVIDDTHIRATVYAEHVFCERVEGEWLLSSIQDKEIGTLKQILKEGNLYVDVPIDLQGLPEPMEPNRVWQLTLRSVDKAFGGKPPLADRIGSYVARFRSLLTKLEIQSKVLGNKVFETYPAASLKELKIHCEYKPKKKDEDKNALYNGIDWEGHTDLCQLVKNLGMSAKKGEYFSDDHIDAVICALTGVLEKKYLLQGVELQARIDKYFESNCVIGISTKAPPNYVLIKKLPENLKIELEMVNNFPEH